MVVVGGLNTQNCAAAGAECFSWAVTIRIVEFIYAELDSGSDRDRRSVAAMAIDLSKAFNRLDHSKLVTLLFDLGVPPCALRLLTSYLSYRTMRVHLSDAISTVYDLWGGGP